MRRALRRLDGVAHVDAVVGGHVVRLRPARDRAVDLRGIRAAMWREGWTVAAVRFTASATVADGALEIDGWREALPLAAPAPPMTRGVVAAEIDADGRVRLR